MDILQRSKIEHKLEHYREVTVFGQKAEYKNGLVYVEGDTGQFENPMTFDTYIHLYLPVADQKQTVLEQTDFDEEER